MGPETMGETPREIHPEPSSHHLEAEEEWSTHPPIFQESDGINEESPYKPARFDRPQEDPQNEETPNL